MKRTVPFLLFLFGFCLLLLAACSPAATSLPTFQPTPVVLPTATPAPLFTPTPYVEERQVELEWPSQLHLGESDVLRLALVPSGNGYSAQAEFPEHTLATQIAPVKRPSGYTLYGIVRLDGVNFDISPSAEQTLLVPPDETVAWRWTLAPRAAGQQRLTISLRLLWQPDAGNSAPVRETQLYTRGIEVQVISFLGLTRSQAFGIGFLGFIFGSGLGVFALVWRQPAARRPLHPGVPNLTLAIECGQGMRLSNEESRLMQVLFSRYSRLVLEREFLSGYSGARTFLARPILMDGRNDASTIVKIGTSESIQNEYANYEAFVKDRLPPITARIQRPPVTRGKSERAALQYTCITEPGRAPVSLGQLFLKDPDPAPLFHLFDTFGPNWWMQHQPYTFRLGQEYDCLLPPYLVLEESPDATAKGPSLDENTPIDQVMQDFATGSLVSLGRFSRIERRADGRSWTLMCKQAPGQPPLRVRWQGAKPPTGRMTCRVTGNRMSLLREWTASFERFGLPDPLENLERWLQIPISGTRSTIHGDLNLENILVGPGNLLWLIDFAQTREGHPLFDFAHLASELVAQVLAVQSGSPETFLALLQTEKEARLAAIEEIARRCLFIPNQPGEYYIPLTMACLGALKYSNHSLHAKHCLYLTAAFYSQKI